MMNSDVRERFITVNPVPLCGWKGEFMWRLSLQFLVLMFFICIHVFHPQCVRYRRPRAENDVHCNLDIGVPP